MDCIYRMKLRYTMERYGFVHLADVIVPVCCIRSVRRALLTVCVIIFVWCKINNLPLVRLIILQPED